MKQLVSPVKGTRDFYPEDMAFRNWLYGKIKEVSEKFGYQEFDGPEIEYIELYSEKTSEEIIKEQAFSLKDRDDRTLILRPELTPTFARMVAQRSQQIPQPVRWFSFGRAWRYEQPQKGRGREFFQWEINILGPETPEADAEILAIAAEYFKTVGLTPDEVVIRVNDRSCFAQVLKENNIAEEKFMPLLRLVDRKEKMSNENFQKALQDEGLTDQQIDNLNSYFDEKNYSKSPWLKKVFESLENYPGTLDYLQYDPTIARGFDYYTRTVFEAWDKTGNLKRALFGGGRYDNLTETLGGDRIPGVGMAPGDMPIQVLLEQFNKMPKLEVKTAKALVTIFNDELENLSFKIASTLRDNGVDTEVWLEPNAKLEKQLKYADQKGIPFCLIIGPDEAQSNSVVLKDLNAKTQETLSLDQVINKLSL